MASQNPNHRNSLYPSIDISDLAEDLVPDNTSPSAAPTVADEIQWPLAKDEAAVKVDSKASKRMNDTTASSASGGSSFTGFDVGSTTSTASLGTRFSFATKPSTLAVYSVTAPAFGGDNLKCHSFSIAFDIDDVILLGNSPFSGSLGALRRLYDVDGTLKIPYVFFTNGGGFPEAKKAFELSQLLGINFSPSQVLQGHSPFKELVHRFENKLIVAMGKGDHVAVMSEYGFKNVLSIDKYASFFENIDPLYICIGSVNKVLNMLCCWVKNPNSEAFKLHLPRIYDYLKQAYCFLLNPNTLMAAVFKGLQVSGRNLYEQKMFEEMPKKKVEKWQRRCEVFKDDNYRSESEKGIGKWKLQLLF
ncbi:Terpenoid cyclases/protein prenyltransferase alpha-alpha toroid [Sesbania bispinosa]|nr:Terpenoid cyclases/protein prenyltransferase alpha-alpha toroid [Sesbania bispinosa]